jgi:hypothetical protein
MRLLVMTYLLDDQFDKPASKPGERVRSSQK